MRTCTAGLLVIPGAHCDIKVAGLSLLHRALLSGYKAGIQEWLLCTWYDAARVCASLAADARLRKRSWQVYDMQNVAPASLESVLPAEEVIVIACTAVFDYRLLLALQTHEGTTLCVTTTTGSSTAAGRSEGISLRSGQVMASPATTPAAYYTTGVLRCPGEILGQLIPAAWGTPASLSNPMPALLQRLIAHTRVEALDVSQYLWIPLTAPSHAEVATAEAQLLRSLGREGDSLIGRVLDRPISRTLTKRLVHTALTPNQITACSALIGLSGACLLAQPAQAWQVLGSLLFLVSTILDGCDGEMARLRFQESAFGAKFDAVMDNVVHLFLFPGIALGLYRQQYDSLYLVLGAFALGGVLISMVVFLPYVLGRQQVHSSRIHDSLASRDFAYLLPILALLHGLHWFLWATAVGTYLFAAAWIVLLWRQRQRQRRRLAGEEGSSA